MLDFKNRTIVVTGAGGNLGSAVAHAFEAQGAQLALLDRDRDILGAAFGAEDDNRLLLPVDLLDRDRVRTAAETIVERFGQSTCCATSPAASGWENRSTKLRTGPGIF